MGYVHIGCVQKSRTQPMCPHCAAYPEPSCSYDANVIASLNEPQIDEKLGIAYLQVTQR